jgi:hypothetical protein
MAAALSAAMTAAVLSALATAAVTAAAANNYGIHQEVNQHTCGSLLDDAGKIKGTWVH